MENSIEIIKFIGNRIMYFRKACGMSREETAKSIGVSVRTLAAYERGEREMSMITVLALAELYNVTITKLTDYKKIMNDYDKDMIS